MRINRVGKELFSEKTPVLSIGMIFKNEIRCLERCMKALQPLRDAIPCELVMADTGSDDGSREVAAKYADIFFEFPWIDDFAAARNAVMDRCSGEWYFSIDADEWLDEDISNLVAFFSGNRRRENIAAGLIIRNYNAADFERYSDMLGVRLVRMDTGVRYSSPIHEALDFGPGQHTVFSIKTVMHHDGYIAMETADGGSKNERNMALLEKQLAEDPENLRTLVECVESGRSLEERRRYLKRAVEGVEAKHPRWEVLGPSIFRYDVSLAYLSKLPDLEERAARAFEWFPDSLLVQVDVSYYMAHYFAEKSEHKEAIPWAEKYFEGMAEYHTGNADVAQAIAFGVVTCASEKMELEARIILANSYCHEGLYDKSVELIDTVDLTWLNWDLARNYVITLMELHSRGNDMTSRLMEYWRKITAPEAEEKWSGTQRAAIIDAAGTTFQKTWRDNEDINFRRHAYTLFLPLENECETGLAAAVLETDDPTALEEKLNTITDWGEFSIHALAHALKQGIRFPLSDKKLSMEEMDSLAGRLTQAEDGIGALALESARHTGTLAQLCWSRGLLLRGVVEEASRLHQEKRMEKEILPEIGEGLEKEDENRRTLALLRGFAEVEGKFLPAYYAPEILTEEGLFLLPPMHRFGWYCAQAFTALDGGDAVGCVRMLHNALGENEAMSGLVNLLLEDIQAHERGKAVQAASPELLALAEKINSMLEEFAPDDPALAALKESPVYQRVAHLIEKQ